MSKSKVNNEKKPKEKMGQNKDEKKDKENNPSRDKKNDLWSDHPKTHFWAYLSFLSEP